MALPVKPTPAQLRESERYQKIAEIDIYNPNPFFQQYGRRSVFLTAYLLLISSGMGYLGAISGIELTKNFNGWHLFGNVLLLIAFLFLILLPLHEMIHAVTYKYFGASDIRFKFSLNPPSVFTCAPLLVVNLAEVIWLASLPLLLISISLAAAAYFVPAHRLLLGWALLIHAFCCVGDMILISYAIKNRHAHIYNFDDLSAGKSYFFEEKSNHLQPG